MGKQESVSDFYQFAKDLSKAEKELKVERWVEVTLYYGYADKQVSLYHYDLPREMYLRYQWVIRWRMAKLQCQYPKQIIGISLYHYDKRSGESMKLNSCLSKLISAKAQVIRAYIVMVYASLVVKDFKQRCGGYPPLLYPHKCLIKLPQL